MPKVEMKYKWFFSFAFLICHSLFHLTSFAQQTKTDSLENILKTISVDTMRVKVLNDLAGIYKNTGQYEKGLKAAKEAIDILEKKFSRLHTNELNLLAIAYSNSGLVYFRQGNFSEALKQHSKALDIRQKTDDKKGIATSYGNIGVIYDNQGNYPKALEYHFKGLKIREQISDKRGIAASLGNIGEIYRGMKDYNKALEYYLSSLDTAKKINTVECSDQEKKQIMANALNNIGIIYDNQGNFPKALEYYFQALALRQETKDKGSVAASFNNIGIIYKKQGDYDGALEYYFKSLAIKKEIGNKKGMSATLLNMGDVYVLQKKFPQAEDHIGKSLQLAKEVGSLDLQREIYKAYYELDEARKNYKEAAINYKKYISIRDSISNEENTKKTTRLAMQYEFDKKEAQAKAEQEKKDTIDAEKAHKQKIILLSVSSGLLLVILFAGFIFRSYSQIKKKNKLITEQKEIIEQKQKEILDSIHYAARIQRCMLPTEKYISQSLKRLMKK